MKKIIILIAAVLIGVSANAQSLKFAHVNFQELVQLMPEMDSARVQSEVASQEAQETYQAMVQEFQTKYQQFEQKQATWTPAVKESKQRELAEIQNRIQEFEQAIQQDMQQLQNTLMAPIIKKAQDTVNNMAKAKGFIYVFDSTSILYIDATQSTDITKDAREVLGIAADKTMEGLQAELQAKAQQVQQ